MVKTETALITSLISAIVIALIYWVITLITHTFSVWAVGILVFLFSFIGMKWKSWFN